MGFDKNPDELGCIWINKGKVGTKLEGTESFSGKLFDIPCGVPVVFEEGSYVAKPGKPNAGETVRFYRVLLAPPPGADVNEDGGTGVPF